jgi:large subunit ribosomal protein L17
MRHRKASLKLNRTTSHRKAMFRNMVTSLFKHDRIRTTGVKAKELRRWADHIITLAKRGDLHARRQALSIIREKGVVHKLFEEAPERFGHSAGGYTRIVKLGRRAGDAAPMSLIELVVPEAGRKKKAKKKAGKSAAEKKKTKADKKAAVETAPEKKPPKKKAKSDKKEEKADVKPEKASEQEEKAEEKAKRASKKKTEKDAKSS